jgi:hypothetical protein
MSIKKYIKAIMLGFVVMTAALPPIAAAQWLPQKQSADNGGNPTPVRLQGDSIAEASITNVDTIYSASTVGASNTIAGSTNSSSSSTPQFMESDGEKYRVVSFAQLASFIFAANADTDSLAMTEQLPAAIRYLNEKSVAVTGFMLPVQTENNLTTDFLLLRNQSACCYGVMPKINEWVIVRTTGKGVKAIMDTPITVLGTFHVGAVGENGSLSGIYKLDCDRIINPKE